MTHRLVPFLAFVVFLTLVANVLHAVFAPEAAPVGPTRAALAKASELPGKTAGTAIPRDSDAVLRVALVLTARWGDATAIGDVVDVPVRTGAPTGVSLSVTRALLPEFGGPNINGSVRLRCYPGVDECDVLWFDRESFSLLYTTLMGEPGGAELMAVRMPERWAVRKGSPLVRVSVARSAALLFVLLSPEEAKATDGGTIGFWRERLRRAAASPVADRERVDEAVRRIAPRQQLVTLGPESVAAPSGIVDAALGAFLRGDEELMAELRARAAGIPDLVPRVLAAVRHDRPDEEWALTDTLVGLVLLRALPSDPNRIQAAVTKHLGADQAHNSLRLRARMAWPPVRTLRFFDGPDLDQWAVEQARKLLRFEDSFRLRLPRSHTAWEYDRTGNLSRYAFEHDPPADRTSVLVLWEEARERYLDRLDWAVRWRLEKPDQMIAAILLVFASSLAVALIRPGRRPRLRVTRTVIFWLYFLTVTNMLGYGIAIGYLLAPAWLVIFTWWLRCDVEHPLWERALILVALFSSALHLLFRESAAEVHPLVEALVKAWIGFAWVVLGRIILLMPDHADSKPFRTFLVFHVFLGVQWTGARLTGEADVAAPALITTLAVASAALLWFLSEDGIRRHVRRMRGRA